MSSHQIICFCMGLLLAGCTSPGTRLENVSIERFSSATVEIENIRVFADENGKVFVAGSVRKNIGCLDTLKRQLEIEALNEEGQVLAKTVTKYFPCPLPGRRPGIESTGTFEAHLEASASPLVKIRVGICP